MLRSVSQETATCLYPCAHRIVRGGRQNRGMLPIIALAFAVWVPALLAGLVTMERWSAAR